MKLTPVDIKNQEFKVKLRGYDSEEVRSFQEMIAGEIDDLYNENERLKNRLNEREEEISVLKKSEEGFKNTVFSIHKLKERLDSSAEKRVEEIIKEAEGKAKNIIKEADIRANNILTVAEVESEKIIEELADLKAQKNKMKINFRTLLNSYLKLLDMESTNDEIGKDFTINNLRSAVKEIPFQA